MADRPEPPPLALVAAGVCTPLGLTLAETAAEMAAGTLRFEDTDVLDGTGEPVRACRLPLIPDDATRTERMTALAVTALAEALDGLTLPRHLALVLALPADDALGPVDLGALTAALVGAAPRETELRPSPALVVRGGRAAPFAALRLAAAHAARTREGAAVAVAVDSLCDPASLDALQSANRTLGERAPGGLIPGEGAAALLLMDDDARHRAGLSAQLRIEAVAVAREPVPAIGPEPSPADGLTAAFRQLRTHPLVAPGRTDWLLSAQTGEGPWAREFAYAYLRNAALMPEPLVGDLVAEALGDAGAAGAAVQLATAPLRLAHLGLVGRPARALAYGSSDDGAVGACLLQTA